MEKLLFDGSMGALLISKGFGGDSASLNVENYEVIRDIHTSYISAGANIIITNTFSLSAKEKNNSYPVKDIIDGALKSAKEAVGEGDVKIAFDLGPSGLDMYPLGDAQYADAYKFYKDILTIADDRFDYVLIETFTNIEEFKAAVDAAKDVTDKPVFASMAFDKTGHTMFGVGVKEFTDIVNDRGVYAAGLNCNLLPEEMYDVAKAIREHLSDSILLFAQPNRGVPKMVDGILTYDLSDEEYAEDTLRLLTAGVDILGGCCGSNERCIELIRKGL